MADSIKGLLFDKDGTLFDFQSTWTSWWAKVLPELAGSRDAARELGAKIGFDLDTLTFADDSVAIAGTTGEIAMELMKHLPGADFEAFLAHLDQSASQTPQFEVIPLLPFLQSLRPDYALGLATNDTERAARAHLASAGIEDQFDFIAGFDSGFGGKPQPGMQKAFCKAQSLRPAQVAMIGDSTHDLISGRAAGMTTVAVLTGHALADELQPYADVVLPSIAELPDWLVSK